MTRLQRAIADLAAAVEARDVAEANAVARVRREFEPIMARRTQEYADADREAFGPEEMMGQ